MYTYIGVDHVLLSSPGVHNKEPTAYQAAKDTITFSSSIHLYTPQYTFRRMFFRHYVLASAKPICKVLTDDTRDSGHRNI